MGESNVFIYCGLEPPGFWLDWLARELQGSYSLHFLRAVTPDTCHSAWLFPLEAEDPSSGPYAGKASDGEEASCLGSR